MVVTATSSDTAARTVTFTRTGYVSRQTALRVPGADATVSMIPSTFNLGAFDELLRVTHLQRWTVAPPLIVQSRVLQFVSVNAATATGLDEVMTPQEREDLEADLTWALPQLTGNAFGAFAGITRPDMDAGASMQVLNTGAITVARYAGLTAATSYWGYARWQFRTDGTVIGGTIMLDRDFDRSGSVFRRSLRAHELGHALGYTHVSGSGLSVMHPAATLEPTLFDRQATLIAFQRLPGNMRPDADPSGASLNTSAAGAIWSIGAGAGSSSYGAHGLQPVRPRQAEARRLRQRDSGPTSR